jgi:hypothetical protein
MLEYLTADRVSAFFLFLISLDKILRRVAPVTGTKADDDLVVKIDKAKKWAGDFGPLLFGIVEDLANVGKLAPAKKAEEFLSRLHLEWMRANPGEALPLEAEAEAKLIAAGMAAAVPHKDPTPGPVSK